MRRWTSVLDAVGLIAVVVGLGLIWLPVGLVGFGAAALLISWRSEP